MNLSEGKAESLQKELLVKFSKFTEHKDGVKGALLELGLSEDQIKLSRSFLPYLPKYQKPECRANLTGASGASGEEEVEVIPHAKASSLKLAVAEGRGKAHPIEDLGNLPASKDKATLSEYFGRYDWTSFPSNPTRDMVKNLHLAKDVVGFTTNRWKKLSLNEKFSILAKHYGQE
jgi:hypothetical protein